jgi:hypothetical protein
VHGERVHGGWGVGGGEWGVGGGLGSGLTWVFTRTKKSQH